MMPSKSRCSIRRGGDSIPNCALCREQSVVEWEEHARRLLCELEAQGGDGRVLVTFTHLDAADAVDQARLGRRIVDEQLDERCGHGALSSKPICPCWGGSVRCTRHHDVERIEMLGGVRNAPEQKRITIEARRQQIQAVALDRCRRKDALTARDIA